MSAAPPTAYPAQAAGPAAPQYPPQQQPVYGQQQPVYAQQQPGYNVYSIAVPADYYRSGDFWCSFFTGLILTCLLTPFFALCAYLIVMHPRSRLGVGTGIGLGSIILGIVFLSTVLALQAQYCPATVEYYAYYCSAYGWWVFFAVLLIVLGLLSTVLGLRADRKMIKAEAARVGTGAPPMVV